MKFSLVLLFVSFSCVLGNRIVRETMDMEGSGEETTMVAQESSGNEATTMMEEGKDEPTLTNENEPVEETKVEKIEKVETETSPMNKMVDQPENVMEKTATEETLTVQEEKKEESSQSFTAAAVQKSAVLLLGFPGFPVLAILTSLFAL